MEQLILKDLCEFQWFWIVLEERKKKEEFWTFRRYFQKLADWTSREYLGLNVILKEEFEEMGFMKLVADLKSLNLI